MNLISIYYKLLKFFVFRPNADIKDPASSKSKKESKDKSNNVKVKKNLVSIIHVDQTSKVDKKRKLNVSKERKVVKKIKKSSV